MPRCRAEKYNNFAQPNKHFRNFEISVPNKPLRPITRNLRIDLEHREAS